ncbi:hypothetical protein ACFOND_10090 [Reinekea marina]|uniref:Glycosyl transferase family 2 n=2 Tax=Reinekea marina TaxID=1310421 RepID=A0ABV7WU75_9GAMM
MIVNSCNDYGDVVPLFLAALKEYWPSWDGDIIINNEKYLEVNHLTDLKRREVTWGKRLQLILQSIQTNYVLMVFDDYILESKVNVSKFNEFMEILAKDENQSVFYLNAVCLRDHSDDKVSNFRILKDKVDFRINSAPAVWRKNDLQSYVGEKDNPWAWEVFGTYRSFGDGKVFCSPSSVENNLFNYNYKKGGAIYRGKWVREVVVDKCEKYGIDIDFNKRGFTDDLANEKRTWLWKVKFIWLGFRMVGFKSLYYFIGYVRAKAKGNA